MSESGSICRKLIRSSTAMKIAQINPKMHPSRTHHERAKVRMAMRHAKTSTICASNIHAPIYQSFSQPCVRRLSALNPATRVRKNMAMKRGVQIIVDVVVAVEDGVCSVPFVPDG